MVEKDVIIKRLAYLDEYLRDLEELKNTINWQKFSADKIQRRYAERTLHMSVEACLDIANRIISYEGYREPSNNRDVFQVLCEEGIISERLTDQLKKMAQFRNVVVHDYIRVQPEIVYAIIQKNLTDIYEFCNIIRLRFLTDNK